MSSCKDAPGSLGVEEVRPARAREDALDAADDDDRVAPNNLSPNTIVRDVPMGVTTVRAVSQHALRRQAWLCNRQPASRL